MQEFITPEFIGILVSAGLLSGLTQLLKSKFPKIDPKIILGILALLFGVLGQIIIQFSPLTLHMALMDYVVGASGLSVLFYETFKKKKGHVEGGFTEPVPEPPIESPSQP